MGKRITPLQVQYLFLVPLIIEYLYSAWMGCQFRTLLRKFGVAFTKQL